MKHLLLAIALVFALLSSGYSYGQKLDSNLMKAWSLPANRENTFTITPKQDTIKVLMLVADTTYYDNMSSGFFMNGKSYNFNNREHNVWWQFGYEVREQAIYNMRGYINTGYLDEKKKPLPKSIIVWQTKEIKP